MIFPQFVIYVLIYDYLKFRKDPSITSQDITNYISVALAVALNVLRTNGQNLTKVCIHINIDNFILYKFIPKTSRLD